MHDIVAGVSHYTIMEDGLTAYRKLLGREYGGAIAELGETVRFHVQGMNHKFPKEVGKKESGCARCRRHTSTSYSDTKAGQQKMVEGFVCPGGLHATGTKAQFVAHSAGTETSVLDVRSRGKVWIHGGRTQSMRGKRRFTQS